MAFCFNSSLLARFVGKFTKHSSVNNRYVFNVIPAARFRTNYAGRKAYRVFFRKRKNLVLTAAATATCIIGWTGYLLIKDRPLLAKALPSVYAKSIDDNDDHSLPLSKKFNFIAEVVESTAPSVVHVETAATNRTYFGDVITQGSGSGFIVSEDGLLLTNAHVVQRAQKVKIKLYDGKEILGHVIDIDLEADLALVKLNTKSKLPYMSLGSSNQLRPGEWVIAMGSPLSLSNTITVGIVSTVHRDIPGMQSGIQYIQTDAAINVGNSGGPLVNLDGEAIGINTMKAVVPGISFAIPIDVAKSFLNRGKLRSSSKQDFKQILDYYIGISMLTLTPSILSEIKSRTDKFGDITSGVYLPSVAAGSPAARAGLRKGDVIVEINGAAIKNSKEIFAIVKKGESMQVTVKRGGQEFSCYVTPETIY